MLNRPPLSTTCRLIHFICSPTPTTHESSCFSSVRPLSFTVQRPRPHPPLPEWLFFYELVSNPPLLSHSYKPPSSKVRSPCRLLPTCLLSIPGNTDLVSVPVTGRHERDHSQTVNILPSVSKNNRNVLLFYPPLSLFSRKKERMRFDCQKERNGSKRRRVPTGGRPLGSSDGKGPSSIQVALSTVRFPSLGTPDTWTPTPCVGEEGSWREGGGRRFPAVLFTPVWCAWWGPEGSREPPLRSGSFLRSYF